MRRENIILKATLAADKEETLFSCICACGGTMYATLVFNNEDMLPLRIIGSVPTDGGFPEHVIDMVMECNKCTRQYRIPTMKKQ